MENYNEKSKELTVLMPGMQVMFRECPGSEWKPATILGYSGDPHIYLLKTHSGSQIRRNRKFIREISPKLAEKLTQDRVHQQIQDDLQRSSKLVTTHANLYTYQ